NPTRLRGEVVYASPEMVIPTEIDVVGRYLAILDRRADSAVTVIRRSDGHLVHRFGRQGAGPGEFRAAWSLDPAAGDGQEFWVYDVTLSRLTHVDLRRLSANRRPTRSIRLATSAPVMASVWLDSTLVTVGFFQ